MMDAFNLAPGRFEGLSALEGVLPHRMNIAQDSIALFPLSGWFFLRIERNHIVTFYCSHNLRHPERRYHPNLAKYPFFCCRLNFRV
jgi:hypothetical protein